MTVTEATLATAFTEWDRRYREEPERFQREATRLLKSDADTYGKECAPYLLSILAEQADQDPTVAPAAAPVEEG